ncbi:hypothetical protein, partial [Nitrosomonas sp.]|uniref:hypothetical protein n=1 Tax=Nitrosomonas sp. TaxID=42353 RepID=UPI001D7D88AA
MRQALSALLVGIGSAYLFGPPTAEELLLVMEPQDTYWLALQIWKDGDRSAPRLSISIENCPVISVENCP